MCLRSPWSRQYRQTPKASQVGQGDRSPRNADSNRLRGPVSGGLVNTAFQIGTAIGLAVCSIVQNSQSGGLSNEQMDTHARARSLSAGLWMATGLAGVSCLMALLFIKRSISIAAGPASVH